MSAFDLSLRAGARRQVCGLCFLVLVGIAAWLGLGRERPALRAAEPAAPGRQAGEPVGSVDDRELLKAGGDDANWLLYGRTYSAQRYSALNQINAKNVSRLIPVWTFQTGVLDGFECTPLVIDGIMYLTTPWNHGYAIDCKTGSQIWHYQKLLPENLALCCDAVNRGFRRLGRQALHGDTRRPSGLPRPQQRRRGLGRADHCAGRGGEGGRRYLQAGL